MITITIDSTDRTSVIDQTSLRYSQRLSKEPASFTFEVSGEKFKPSIGDDILVQVDGSNFFKGTIIEREEAIKTGKKVVGYRYRCLDGYFSFDRKLVIKAYNNTTLKAVIENIVSTYTSGFTVNIPATTPTVTTARFNYEQPSRCIQKLCDSVGWDWYIDANDVVRVFASENVVAPYIADETSGYIIPESLEFDRNIVELRNVVYVRGGEYNDPINEADAVDKYESNGTDNTFPLVYRYANVQVTVNGIPQTVGVDFIDLAADFDCLYNFQEKLVKFPDGTLNTGDVVRVYGDANIPLIVAAEDPESVVEYGEREGIEINKSIDSIEEAESLANALLEKWREGSREGSFMSYESGWVVGQTVTVVSTTFNVNTTYKVNRVTAKMRDHESFVYQIDFIKSGQTTFSDLLISLIGKDKENITIADNEVLQKFRKVYDEFSMSDEIVSVSTDSPPYQYSGDVISTPEEDFEFQDGTDFFFQDEVDDFVFIESSSGSAGDRYNFATYT